jgi:hypothetical protein
LIHQIQCRGLLVEDDFQPGSEDLSMQCIEHLAPILRFVSSAVGHFMGLTIGGSFIPDLRFTVGVTRDSAVV